MGITQRRRQRIRDRVPCNLNVMVNGSLSCLAIDIREGGLYLKTGDVFAIGSAVKLCLPFKGEKLEISARIKYCLKGVGIGLMFIDPDDMLKEKNKGTGARHKRFPLTLCVVFL